MRGDLALILFLLTLAGGIALLVLRKKRGGAPLLIGGIVLLICAAALALYLAAAVMLVLAVHIHQQRSKLSQHGQRQYAAGDAADIAPAAVQLARDARQTVLNVQAQRFRHLERSRVFRNIKQRLYAALFRAAANNLALCAAAQREIYAIHHDGLARARFARKHIESLHKFNAQRFNQSNVLNCKFQQHGFISSPDC